MREAVERLISKVDTFADDLREIIDDLPQDRGAGVGEAPEEEMVQKAAPAQERARNGIDDNSTITLKSGDLRKVVDAYRKLVRYARNGRVPAQEERFDGHRAVKAVKHLIRPPKRGRD